MSMLSYETVRKRFEDKGFELLDKEYKGAKVYLNYKCHCGAEAKIKLGNLSKQQGCSACAGTRGKDTRIERFGTCCTTKPLDYDVVVKRFSDHGHTLLTEEYTGDTQKLTYRCKCGNKATTTMDWFRKSHAGCSVCTEENRRLECQKKYGTDFPTQNEEIKAKAKATCVERYDCENPGQNPEIKEKIKATHKELYGGHPMKTEAVKEKQKAVMIDKHGVDNPMKSKEVQDKQKATCKERYGKENPMQVPEFQKKAHLAFKTKEYTFPSGRTAEVQGYEALALDLLLERYPEEVIEPECDGKVPVIDFFFEENWCRFFPDIAISGTNRIIEVKSTYWWEEAEERNIAKLHACAAQGYDIEFWIFDNKKKLVEIKKGVIATCGDGCPFASEEHTNEDGIKTLILTVAPFREKSEEDNQSSDTE